MILRLEVPFLETYSRVAIITRWHATEGDLLDFGDHICEVALSERMALLKTKRASNLARIQDQGQRKVRHDFEVRKMKGLMAMSIVASESCYLRRVDVDVGERVEVGDLLGLVSTGPEDPIPVGPSGTSTMRVVAVSADVREGSP